MSTDPLELIEVMYEARRRRDIDAMFALCSDAVVYSCNIDPDKPGSGNTMIGKAQNRAHIALIDAIWEPLSTSIGPLRAASRPDLADTTIVRAVITFSMRHKPSGQVLDGTKTHEWTVRDGKVVSMCETLDRQLINAFMRMTEWSAVRPAETPRALLPISTPDRTAT